MEKFVPFLVYILMGIILFLINDSICKPVVFLRKREIYGQSKQFGRYEVNEYLGIPYAKPPLGHLRFQKTQKLRKVPRKFEAVNLPPACLQYSRSPYPWYVNGTKKSEDCLYLNIWTPSDASIENKKAVFFWVHGGGFRFGSIQDELYNGVALAAEGDIIVVTANYRLGAFGFLTTGTDEAPGNAGLYDSLEALKWVNRNIEFFGGDTSRITIAGESAGSLIVAYFSISPLAVDLFSNMIMESGSPGALPEDTKLLNLGLSELLALKVGCATDAHSLADHPQSVAKCLKNKPAEELERAEFQNLPGTKTGFLPQYGDKLLPKSPRRSVSTGDFRCKKLLIGNNRDEASLALTTTAPEVFGFFGEKNARINQTFGAKLLKKLVNNWLPGLLPPVATAASNNPLLKDVSVLKPDNSPSILDDLLQTPYSYSRHEIYTVLGDLVIICPDVYFAEKCAEKGGDVYFYSFVHRPSTTPWAPWMGVAHFEEVQFVFGKPLLESELYLVSETKLSRKIIELWSNFVKTGKPNESWPLYSKENPVFRYIGNKNSSQKYGRGPHKKNCDLFRSFSAL